MAAENVGSLVEQLLIAPEAFPTSGIERMQENIVLWDELGGDRVLLSVSEPGYFVLQTLELKKPLLKVTDYIFRSAGISYVARYMLDTDHEPPTDEEIDQTYDLEMQLGMNAPVAEDKEELIFRLSAGLSRIGILTDVIEFGDV